MAADALRLPLDERSLTPHQRTQLIEEAARLAEGIKARGWPEDTAALEEIGAFVGRYRFLRHRLGDTPPAEDKMKLLRALYDFRAVLVQI